MDKFYTATELMDKLQLTRQTIYNLVNAGSYRKGAKSAVQDAGAQQNLRLS